MKEMHEFIRRVDVFFGLNDKERETILDGAEEREYGRKDLIFGGSGDAEGLFVVKRGAVKTIKGDNGAQRLLVDFVKQGEVIGEEALFSGEHELVAAPFESSSALFIPSDNVMKVLENQPRLGRALAALSASRARAYRERLYQMNAIPVPVRLASTLGMLARRFGKRDRQGTMISLRVTHQDLADYVGAARETVTLFLSKFREEKLIVMNVRKIIIPDLKALKKHAQ